MVRAEATIVVHVGRGHGFNASALFRLPDILDTRRRVDVQLSMTLAKQKLDSSEIALVNGQTPREFISIRKRIVSF